MNFTANQCDFHWEPFNFPCFLSFGKLSWFDFATLGKIAFRNKHGIWVYSDRVMLHKVAWFVTTYNHGLQNTILNIFAIFIIFYEILTILHDFNSSYKFEIFDNFLILYHFLTILKVLTFLAKFWQFWTLMTILYKYSTVMMVYRDNANNGNKIQTMQTIWTMQIIWTILAIWTNTLPCGPFLQ